MTYHHVHLITGDVLYTINFLIVEYCFRMDVNIINTYITCSATDKIRCVVECCLFRFCVIILPTWTYCDTFIYTYSLIYKVYFRFFEILLTLSKEINSVQIYLGSKTCYFTKLYIRVVNIFLFISCSSSFAKQVFVVLSH